MWAYIVVLCVGIAGAPTEQCRDNVEDAGITLDDCRARVNAAVATPETVELKCARMVEIGKDIAAQASHE